MIIAEADLFSPVIQGGMAGVAFLVIGILGFVIKRLFNIVSNHLMSIKKEIANLPCNDHKQRIEWLERSRLKSLKE